MTTLDKVRALFVEGEDVVCVDNTYHQKYVGKTWRVGKVGKSVWTPAEDGGFRGTFPTRASDVVAVDEASATWRIGRGDHTVTYARVVECEFTPIEGDPREWYCTTHDVIMIGPEPVFCSTYNRVST